MAIIVIIFGSVIGVFVGLFQFAVLGGTLWQAFVTYMAASFLLSAIIGSAALIMSYLKNAENSDSWHCPRDAESWQDWQTEEEMEVDRLEPAADDAVAGARAI